MDVAGNGVISEGGWEEGGLAGVHFKGGRAGGEGEVAFKNCKGMEAVGSGG